MEFKHNGNSLTVDEGILLYTKNISGKYYTLRVEVTNDTIVDFVKKVENIGRIGEGMFVDFATIQTNEIKSNTSDLG